jgi:hypothetical protein
VCEQGAPADTSSSPADPYLVARRCSLTSDLPPNERVGNLQGLAEGRGCRARVPLESPPPRRPSETLAAADHESLLLPRIANRRRCRRLGMLGETGSGWACIGGWESRSMDGRMVRVSGSGTGWFGGLVGLVVSLVRLVLWVLGCRFLFYTPGVD